MEILRQKVQLPRAAEIEAINAPLADEPFLPSDLDITVVYGGHSDKRDFTPLVPHLQDADVFIPEITAWNEEQVQLMSRIAQGDKRARRELEQQHAAGRFTPFTAAETKWLLRSGGIRITPIDYSAHHDKADEILSHFSNWQTLDKVVPSFGKTLANIDAYIREEAELEDHREDIMIRSIGPRLEALIANDPELDQKERVKVVIQQGTAHTYFYQDLVKLAAIDESVSVQRFFNEGLPVVFNHFDQLARAYRAGIEVTREQSRELSMRVLARTALRFNKIPHVIEESDYVNGRLVLPPAEEMVDRFSTSAIKAFHQEVAQSIRRR